MQPTRTRAERVLQAVKGALFGGKSPSGSLGYETENASTEPVPSSVHNEAGFQAVHDQERSDETPQLDRRPGYINIGTPAEPEWVKPTLLMAGRPIKFGEDHNNEYHAEYFKQTGILTLSVNGTDHFFLNVDEAAKLRDILDQFIELEEQE